MLNSRTLKVNTMQNSSFKELLGEFTHHIRDLLDEEYELFDPRVFVEPIIPPYQVHDGGYVEFTVVETHQVKFERIQDEIARKLHQTAQRIKLGGCYFIGDTYTLRVFAH